MKVCFTGGGSAGHVFPAFQIDKELSKRALLLNEDYERFWIGTRDSNERDWILQAGIPLFPISSGRFRRYFTLRNFFDIFSFLKGLFQAFSIMRNQKPDLVFSKGGFASVPPVVAAWLLGIPSVTHESDGLPGLATRINARFARKVCVPFHGAQGSLQRSSVAHKLVVTGNPVRFSKETASAMKGRERLNLDDSSPILLVLGGSQGALQLNQMVWDNLEQLTSMAFVVHQMGDSTYREISHWNYLGLRFIGDGMADLLAAATVVVSRAGANAVAELVEMGKAMILIPLGRNASRGDQIVNARRLEDFGCAVVVHSNDHTQEGCLQAISALMQNEGRRRLLEERCSVLRTPSAEKKIVDILLELR